MDYKKGIKRQLVLSILTIVIILFSSTDTVSSQYPKVSGIALPNHPRLIAHAGGEIHGIRLTNSLQAMNNSYLKGFRFFEIDVNWTSDGIPVLIHDWGNANWFMNIKHSTEPQTISEFQKSMSILDLQFMDLDLLEEWISQHRDTTIITDAKSKNTKLLKIIKEQYPYIFTHIVPQIYSFEEYDTVKELGYKEIILTLYHLHASENEIIDFSLRNPLFGIAIYSENLSYTLLYELYDIGVKTYIHTVNDYNEYIKLRENGVFGVYTDYFEPYNWVE